MTDKGRAVLLVSTLLALLVATATPGQLANAAGTTCGSFNPHWWGAYRAASNEGVTHMAGAQAQIMVREADLCASISDNTNTSTDWVMLAGTGNSDGFVQVGWGHHAGGCGCRQFFYEDESSDTSNNGPVWIPTSTYFGGGSPALKTAYVFKTTWQDGGDNYIHNIICQAGGTNCQDVDHTTWNPISAGWSGTEVQLFGETHHSPTDLTGRQATTASTTNVQVRKHVSGGGTGWYAPSAVTQCHSNGSGCSDAYWRYHENMLSATEFELWTCPIDPSNPAC